MEEEDSKDKGKSKDEQKKRMLEIETAISSPVIFERFDSVTVIGNLINMNSR